MNDLFKKQKTLDTTIECLTTKFGSDEARREHYLKLLEIKLREPEFRRTSGFPVASDRQILSISDPPYYTACPNPFLPEVLAFATSQAKQGEYAREPFTADVSEGKNDPIYNAHSYHTKVPHKAVMRYILHYTNPGDVVFDGFCGTGMTGVAAQLCGDKGEVESLGYRVDSNGTIFALASESNKGEWSPISKLGERFAVLNDLSPAAAFFAYNYNSPVDYSEFCNAADEILRAVEGELGWAYRTFHEPTTEELDRAVNTIRSTEAPSVAAAAGIINFTVWSDVFRCTNCTSEVVFWEAAIDRAKGVARDEFACQQCGSLLSKRTLERAWITRVDKGTGQLAKQAKHVPVLINYSVGKKRFEKTPDRFDLAVIEKVEGMPIPFWFPTDLMMLKGERWGDTWRAGIHSGVTSVHHFYTSRNLFVLAGLHERIEREHPRYLFWFTSALTWVGRENRLHLSNYFGGGGGVITSLRGTWYFASLAVETSVIERFRLRMRVQGVRQRFRDGHVYTSTGDAANSGLPDNSVDYLFFDPPFGGNLPYSELNFIWEAWLKVFTNVGAEAIESESQGKTLNDYRKLMTSCFQEGFRVLRPSRWLTVEFSNTQAAVWNAIQTALQEAGFVVANVSALDKGKGSFKSVNTTTAVKQDLVISAYKPSGGLEDNLRKQGGTEESVWDFVKAHLKYLPAVKGGPRDLEYITERDPRVLFDRMVSWFVQHGVPVPMSTQEFQAGLVQRFSNRDGMVFLPDQLAAYERVRALSTEAPQMELFVADERSAIDWLIDFLKRRPSTYQEIHPEFIGQLGAGWKKHESKPELSRLLEDNFIQYVGEYDVPPQIHSYLSTNYREMRGLEKKDPTLVSKAKDRWYMPDPNKAIDLEKKREKALLKEFEVYQAAPGRKLKEFRLEVLRAGFKAAWAAKNYKAIIAIAQKIPEEALQEDEKLLLWYDQALTREESGT